MSNRGVQTAAAAIVAVPLLAFPPAGSELAAATVTTHHVKKLKQKRVRIVRKAKRKRYRAAEDCKMLSPEDRDLIVRTVMGEANGESFTGKLAVAAVIKNRLLDGRYGGNTVPGVLFKPKQFEPWNTRKRELMSYDPDDPRYQEAAEAVDRAFSGDDPTDPDGPDGPSSGATHFANVGTVEERGNRTALGWIRSMSNVSKIGRHTFGNADGKGDGRARSIEEQGGGGYSSVLGEMAGLEDNSDIDQLLSLGEPFDIEEAFASLNEPTDDPRRIAVRSLITEILDGLPPSAGQGHAVAPEEGAASEDEEA